jgi:hypothetical protein
MMNAIDAMLIGDDPTQAYGQGVAQTTIEVYTGRLATDIANSKLEKRD